MGKLTFKSNFALLSSILVEFERVANYNWPFGTLAFGLFWSNLDIRDLKTYPRIYSGYFWNMSISDNSRAVWVLFRKWVVSENQSFLDEGTIVWPLISLVLWGEVPRLTHGPIWFPVQNTYGVLRHPQLWVGVWVVGSMGGLMGGSMGGVRSND